MKNLDAPPTEKQTKEVAASPNKQNLCKNCMGKEFGMNFAERSDGTIYCTVCGKTINILTECSN